MSELKEFVVGTFCKPGEKRISRIGCYTRWYERNWDGCIEYRVKAESGKEAKRIAAETRRMFEKKQRLNAMEMPCLCDSCGDWFDLNDGFGGTSGQVFCSERCARRATR